jgi:hypothetical protein
MNDFDKKEQTPNYQEKQKIKESESDSHFFEKNATTKKESSKKSIIPWVIGVFLLFAVPLSLYYLSKRKRD